MDSSNVLNIFMTLLNIIEVLLVIFIIFYDNKKPATTLGWIAVIFFFPGLGILFYLLFGNKLRFQKKKAERVKNIYNKILEENYLDQLNLLDNNNEITFNDPNTKKYIDMLRLNLHYGKSIYTQDNNLSIFTDGTQKYQSLIKDIENATKSIHMLYYIFRNDNIGKQIVELLTQKAQEGVKVVLIYDDFGSFKTSKRIFKPLKKAGGRVYSFLPPRLIFNFRLNYRNHRKLVVIDGKIGYLGGMNIGDEYANCGKNRIKPWRDTHLRLTGSAVYALQTTFLMDLAYAQNEEIVLDRSLFPPVETSGNIGMQIVTSGPDSEKEEIKAAYIKMINSAKKNIYIQSPYFVPDDAFIEALRIAALSGVKVSIMIPGIYDKYFVYCASISYIKTLINLGVDFYLYKGFIHSKQIVIDHDVVSIGTANVDIRSFLLSFEINSFIYNRDIAEKCVKIFDRDVEKSYYLTMERYKKRRLVYSIIEPLARLFSPLF